MYTDACFWAALKNVSTLEKAVDLALSFGWSPKAPQHGLSLLTILGSGLSLLALPRGHEDPASVPRASSLATDMHIRHCKIDITKQSPHACLDYSTTKSIPVPHIYIYIYIIHSLVVAL